MKNWLIRNTINIITIGSLILNFVVFFFASDLIEEYGVSIIWPVLVSVEVLFLYFFVYSIIVYPINELRAEIVKFLTGGKKGQKISIASSHPTLDYIIRFFNESIKILKNFKEELNSGKELKSEVQLASEIQKNTLSKNLPNIPSISIVANTKSASEVGGDSYDVIQQGENYYAYIGDVTGHGVASGFVMMMVNALISGFSKKLISAAEILANTNEILKPRVPSNMLMTLLMVRWNEQTKQLFMTGAGHEYLLVYKKSQGKAYKIKSGGVALGMTKNISRIVREIQIQIEEGDVIILYTDGITEARNTNKEDGLMFGIDRLIETIEKSPFKTAQGIYNSITIDLSKWMGYNHKQFDDITLIVMHYKGYASLISDALPIIPKENITEWNWS